MARLRLLMCVSVLIALSGCSVLPRWSPTLEGVVINELTGEPVAGAEVFAAYEVTRTVAWKTHSRLRDFHWTTTTSDGRFEIPGHLRESGLGWSSRWMKFPRFRVLHPELGFFRIGFSRYSYPGNRELELKVRPSYESRSYFDSLEPSSICPGWDYEACMRMCEVAYGSAESCRKERTDKGRS